MVHPLNICMGEPRFTHIYTNKKELKANLEGIKRANITCRNFPLQADALRKKLGIKDGGDKYIVATTDENGNHLLTICRKV